jgi:hypothetical protein
MRAASPPFDVLSLISDPARGSAWRSTGPHDSRPIRIRALPSCEANRFAGQRGSRVRFWQSRSRSARVPVSEPSPSPILAKLGPITKIIFQVCCNLFGAWKLGPRDESGSIRLVGHVAWLLPFLAWTQKKSALF